jgi:hypothetical protein
MEFNFCSLQFVQQQQQQQWCDAILILCACRM